MGQIEVLAFLKKHRGKWFKPKEIVIKGGISQNRVNHALKQLRKFKEVNFRQIGGRNRFVPYFEYKYKAKQRWQNATNAR